MKGLPMSLTLVAHIGLRISPRIFEKIRNDPNAIIRGLGESDLWKKLKQKISWHCLFKMFWIWPQGIWISPGSTMAKNTLGYLKDLRLTNGYWHKFTRGDWSKNRLKVWLRSVHEATYSERKESMVFLTFLLLECRWLKQKISWHCPFNGVGGRVRIVATRWFTLAI